MQRNRGFSLVELLIVVAIILVIAAIAIPNLLRSRIAANEASAVATLRTINTSEATFASTYNSGFTDSLNRLGTPGAGNMANSNQADLVDPVLAGIQQGSATAFTKNGYNFTYTKGSGTFGYIANYSVSADPSSRGLSGTRSFYSDQSAVVRSDVTQAATAGSPPLQ